MKNYPFKITNFEEGETQDLKDFPPYLIGPDLWELLQEESETTNTLEVVAVDLKTRSITLRSTP